MFSDQMKQDILVVKDSIKDVMVSRAFTRITQEFDHIQEPVISVQMTPTLPIALLIQKVQIRYDDWNINDTEPTHAFHLAMKQLTEYKF